MTGTISFFIIAVLLAVIAVLGYRLKTTKDDYKEHMTKSKALLHKLNNLEQRVKESHTVVEGYKKIIEEMQAQDKEKLEMVDKLAKQAEDLEEKFKEIELLGPELRRYVTKEHFDILSEKFSLIK